MITAADVRAAYRLFLDREPESEEAIAHHLRIASSTAELRRVFLESAEYTTKLAAADRAELEEVRLLQTAPPDANPGIAAGRNIRAGYRRGSGLAVGKLATQIADDPDWMAAMAAAAGRSIVPPHCLMNLFLIIKYSETPGNIIEFGAFRGGSSLFMAALLRRLGRPAKVFALDTFAGMPATDPALDMHRAGAFADTDYAELERLRDTQGLDNLVLLKGLFHETVGQIPAGDRRFFLAHIDCDIYESVRFAIGATKAGALPGAYLVFDDPLVHDCLGALQAVEEELVQKEGLFAEQAYPHLVYRYPPLPGGGGGAG